MLRDRLLEALNDLPLIDIHSHLPRNGLAATSAHKLFFYHMLVYPLRAAGVPEDQLWLDDKMHGDGQDERIWTDAGPQIERTAFGWVLRQILRDLYGIDRPLGLEAFGNLREVMAERAADADWGAAILSKARIETILSSVCAPADPDRRVDVRDTIEQGIASAFCEGDDARRLARIGKSAGMAVVDLESLREAIRLRCGQIDWSVSRVFVQWISSLPDFRPQDDAVLDALIRRAVGGERLALEETALVEAGFLREALRGIRDRVSIVQLCWGIQYFDRRPIHPVTRSSPWFVSSFACILQEFPDLHFNMLNGYEPDEPALCGLALGHGNLSLGGYWWNMFHPSIMHQAWHRRLDMLPTSRLMGFFSDGYCAEWIYGRALLTRRVLANVLAERIERGFLDEDGALEMARDVFERTPRRLLLEA